MRLCPEPKTWTMRPARIVSANQSAAFSIDGSCASTAMISPRHRSRYSLAGVIDAAYRFCPGEMQPIPGGAEGAGVFAQRRRDHPRAPSVGAPLELLERLVQRVEQGRARAGDAAADDDDLRVGDVDERRDGCGQVMDGAEPDTACLGGAGEVRGDEVVGGV